MHADRRSKYKMSAYICIYIYTHRNRGGKVLQNYKTEKYSTILGTSLYDEHKANLKAFYLADEANIAKVEVMYMPYNTTAVFSKNI